MLMIVELVGVELDEWSALSERLSRLRCERL